MVFLHTQQTIEYLRVAPAAVWALDYCLTLEHEVRLFSSTGRWNIATVMFIIARYVPIAWIVSEIYVTLGPHSVQTCLTTYRIAGTSLLLIMLATEGLLLTRTLALWHDNRKIKRFLWASYLVTAISTVICGAITTPLLESACVPTSTQSDLNVATKLERLIMGGFVSTALFELTVAAITVYHSIQLRSDDMHTLYKLAPTLSKGSLVYALSLFAISVANIVSFSLPVSGGYNGIIDVFQGVLHGIIASRILFDLRDANQSQNDSFCLTNLQFVPHVIPTATQSNV
ncbi:uncharacterized protein BJ212DRAFT_1329871 [Suillus subaureus]|uniref:DUF6533 domain-containing protein n=1 Tax=Suillus subaureus TaxID=48587 RepID=A0A9P7EJD0_9AGAM|nr:uncharacterized protein BJ212DRAFT_1329871 [Suillus subaureus]KAG1822686.1 hypothetical protein BJ212DRAFT_1329871 [Suillus subaureus]